MANPINFSTHLKYFLYLHQVGTLGFNKAKFSEIINDYYATEIDTNAIGKDILYLDGLAVKLDVFNLIIGTTLPPNLEILASFNLPKINYTEINKNNWEYFWHLYNILQDFCKIHFVQDDIANIFPIVKAENLDFINLPYHKIAKLLIEKNIDFEKEGGFTLEIADNFAEAEFGVHTLKIFFEPIDEQSKKLFEVNGYTEQTIETFDITKI